MRSSVPRDPQFREDGDKTTLFHTILPQRIVSSKIESYSLWAGQNQCGKTSLLSLLKQETSDGTIPKATVALDYTFARRARSGALEKDVANIWELGGGTHLEGLVKVAVTPSRLNQALLGIVVDLSKPTTALAAVIFWLKIFKDHTICQLGALRAAGGEDDATALEEAAKKRLSTTWHRWRTGDKSKKEKHPDENVVDVKPVPVIILGNKYDIFKNDESLKKKALCQALRFIAHKHGASLAFVSAKDKPLQQSFRSLLSHALFQTKKDRIDGTGVFGKHKQAPVFTTDQPLYVPSGADTFEAIATAGPLKLDLGASQIRTYNDLTLIDALSADPYYSPPDPKVLAKAAAGQSVDENNLELGGNENKDPDEEQYPEPMVDEVVKQKLEALARYRKKMEHKEKELAAEKLRAEMKAKKAEAAEKEKQAEKLAQRKARRNSRQASSSALAAAAAKSDHKSGGRESKRDDISAKDAK